MAKLVFQSNEARDHFSKVVAASIDSDCYFGDQGLHAKIEYLRRYVDNGENYEVVREKDSEGTDRILYARYARCVLCWGRGDEIGLLMQYADRGRGEPEHGEWQNMWVGGLVKHSDGTWGCHT
jgi:hypothetical protein